MNTDIDIDKYLEDLQTYLDNGEEEKMYWQEDMQVLISELKETRRQMQKLKNKNKDLLRKLRNRVKEVNKLIKYSAYKKELSKLNAIIRQKDKQIDLMVDELTCAEFDMCCSECTHECEKDYDQLNTCIKQYFAEQAREV